MTNTTNIYHAMPPSPHQANQTEPNKPPHISIQLEKPHLRRKTSSLQQNLFQAVADRKKILEFTSFSCFFFYLFFSFVSESKREIFIKCCLNKETKFLTQTLLHA